MCRYKAAVIGGSSRGVVVERQSSTYIGKLLNVSQKVFQSFTL
jgi:hypothetical protein